VLCEELFIFDVIHAAKFMLKQGLAWSLILIFFEDFSLDEILLFQPSASFWDRERFLKLLPWVVHCTKGHCF